MHNLATWLLFAAVLIIAPVALRFLAEDHPRSDDPPDTGEGDREPARASLELAA